MKYRIDIKRLPRWRIICSKSCKQYGSDGVINVIILHAHLINTIRWLVPLSIASDKVHFIRIFHGEPSVVSGSLAEEPAPCENWTEICAKSQSATIKALDINSYPIWSGVSIVQQEYRLSCTFPIWPGRYKIMYDNLMHFPKTDPFHIRNWKSD